MYFTQASMQLFVTTKRGGKEVQEGDDIYIPRASLVTLDSKESTCNEGDLGSTPELGRSLGGGHGNPLQYSCLENPHGQRSLAGYSPWGRRESDTTELLSTAHG